MKKAIVLILCAVAILACALHFYRQSSTIANIPSNDDKLRMLAVMKEHFGKKAIPAREAAEAFLKKWSPMGWTKTDLKSAFGKPDIEIENVVTYRFDTGLSGSDFNFEMRSGKVTAFKRTGLE